MLRKDNERIQREKRTDELLGSTLDGITSGAQTEEHNVSDMLMSVDEAFANYKVAFEKSKNVVIPAITPMGQSIITTATLMNILEQRKHLVGVEFNIDTFAQLKKSVSEVQVVVGVGPDCRQVQVGDLVKIRFDDFTRIKNPNSVQSQEVFELPLETIGDKQYIEMHERNVKYIYNDAKVDLSEKLTKKEE